MKILFVGDARLYDAVKRLCGRFPSAIDWDYQSAMVSEIPQIAHAVILDSKWFRDFVSSPQQDFRVIVIGPYTDEMSRDAFANSGLYEYVAYSELESSLVPLLKNWIANYDDTCIVSNSPID